MYMAVNVRSAVFLGRKSPRPFTHSLFTVLQLSVTMQALWKTCACAYSASHLCISVMCVCAFLQRVSIACNAERCTSYSKSVRLSVCLSVTRWHCVKTTPATIMRSSLDDSPMTSFLMVNLAGNSKGNIGSEGAKWERGRKNRQF